MRKETPRARAKTYATLRLTDSYRIEEPSPEAVAATLDELARNDEKVYGYYIAATDRAIKRLVSEIHAEAAKRVKLRREVEAHKAIREAATASPRVKPEETAKQSGFENISRKKAVRLAEVVAREAATASEFNYAVFNTFRVDALRLKDSYRNSPAKLAEAATALRDAIRQRLAADAAYHAEVTPASDAVAEAASGSYNSAFSSKVSPSFDAEKLTVRGKLRVKRGGSYFPSPEAEAVYISFERDIRTVKPKRGYASGSKVSPEAKSIKSRLEAREASEAKREAEAKRLAEIQAVTWRDTTPIKDGSPEAEAAKLDREAARARAIAAEKAAKLQTSREAALNSYKMRHGIR